MFKYKNFAIIVIFALSFSFVVLMAGVKAQIVDDNNDNTTQANESNTMSEADKEGRYEAVYDGLRGVFTEYGIIQEMPEMSREEWVNMHGEIYDIFMENDMDPLMMMRYMPGAKMYQMNMMQF